VCTPHEAEIGNSDLFSTHVLVRLHATIVFLALSFLKGVAQSILENMNFSSLSCGHRMAVFYTAFYLVLLAIELSDLIIIFLCICFVDKKRVKKC
jgi:hypothetical protein